VPAVAYPVNGISFPTALSRDVPSKVSLANPEVPIELTCATAVNIALMVLLKIVPLPASFAIAISLS
jgi:hypothetical protein